MKSLEFTLTVTGCLGCRFCPQENLLIGYTSEVRSMPPDFFTTILSKLPKDCEVHFSGFAECFLHTHAALMMRQAKEAGYRVLVYSTLVGLSPTAASNIHGLKVDLWRVHVPDDHGFVYSPERWISYHKNFLTTQIGASYMAMGEPPPEIKTHLAINNIAVERPDMLSRGGNLWTPKDIQGPMRCTMNRWYNNVVLPNGDVYGCCMDYSLSVYLGNLLRQPYREIEYEAEKWKMAMEKRVDGICARCEWSAPA